MTISFQTDIITAVIILNFLFILDKLEAFQHHLVYIRKRLVIRNDLQTIKDRTLIQKTILNDRNLI